MSTEQTDHEIAQSGNDAPPAGESAPAEKGAVRSSSSRAARVEHFTPAERAARGKAARAEVPRRSHAEWEPPPHRPDPVELLEEQAQTRVPELVPIRYGRMLVSPFTFYRGAAVPDGRRPRRRARARACTCSSAATRTCRTSAPSPRPTGGSSSASTTSTRRCPGPFEWDVKRLVASFAVAGRDRGFDAKQRDADQRSRSARAYREAMREFAAMRNLDVWYARIDVEEHRSRGSPRSATAKQRKRFERNLAKARAKDSLQGVRQADRGRRRRAADRQRPAADRPDRASCSAGARPRASRTVMRDADPLLPAHAAARPPPPARALPLRRRRPQGRRRRQRRHARLDRADARPRRRRPAVPAGQGGAGLGARAVPRQERVRQPRPARGRGPAADAGGQRHHARLAPHRRASTASSATSTSASSGTGRARRSSRRWSRPR